MKNEKNYVQVLLYSKKFWQILEHFSGDINSFRFRIHLLFLKNELKEVVCFDF